jgi:hypothetical protein
MGLRSCMGNDVANLDCLASAEISLRFGPLQTFRPEVRTAVGASHPARTYVAHQCKICNSQTSRCISSNSGWRGCKTGGHFFTERRLRRDTRYSG